MVKTASLAIARLVEAVERFNPVAGFVDFKPERFQHSSYYISVGLIIVSDKKPSAVSLIANHCSLDGNYLVAPERIRCFLGKSKSKPKFCSNSDCAFHIQLAAE